jgi:hypothetical protein
MMYLLSLVEAALEAATAPTRTNISIFMTPKREREREKESRQES